MEAEVRFVIVGGLAVIAWGHERFTRDIDIVPDPNPDNLERLASTLIELGGRVIVGDGFLTGEAIRKFLRAGDITLVTTELGQVDVLQGVPYIPRFSEMLAESASADLDGIEVRVCSGRHLLAMKRAASRDHDLSDIEALLTANPEWRDDGGPGEGD